MLENIATDRAVDIERVYYRKNLLGSSLIATDQDGDVIRHVIYDEWGKPETETYVDQNYYGIDNINNYTGYTYDEVMDIYFAQNRFYDAEARRFNQQDPIKDGVNWYSYGNNNPIVSVDPLGLKSITIDEFSKDFKILFEAATEYEKTLKFTVSAGPASGTYPYSIDKSKLLIGFFRSSKYTGIEWDVTAGEYNVKFNDFLKDNRNVQYRLLEQKYSEEIMLLDNKNEIIDLAHLFAVLGGQYNKIIGFDFASGLGGDMASSIEQLNEIYNKNMALDKFYFSKLGCDDTRISRSDIIA